jgi:ABC-type transport system involved in multi-copper enzyme maturation permease subunit
MWWILMICAAGYLAMMGLLLAFSFQLGSVTVASDPSMGGAPGFPEGDEAAVMVYSMAGSMAYVFPLLVGALSITQEYRHKTITPTFLAEPRREVVLGAKLIASLPMGLIYGLVCLSATALPAAVVFAAMGGSTGLGVASTWAFFGRALLDFTIWAAVGVGLGALIHNQVAVIVVVLAVTQFVEPTLRMLPLFGGWDWKWIDFLPGAAGDAIQGMSIYDGFGLAAESSGLPFGWAALVLAGWAVLFAGIAYPTAWRRDVS